MSDALQKFETVVRRNIHYEGQSDAHGARVLTNLENTMCPRCGAQVEPNVEHLCGNRATVKGMHGKVNGKPPKKAVAVSFNTAKTPRKKR